MIKSKWLAGCLAFAVLSSSTVVFAEQPRFSDIDTSYAKTVIVKLYEKGIMKGVSADRFAPGQAIKRNHFAVVIAKTLGIQPVFPETPTFIDLDASQPEYGYVEALAQLGILAGGGESKFLGENLITRQDTAVVLYRALANDSYVSSKVHTYQDSMRISTYAKDAVNFVTEKGFMTGNNNMFLPQNALTRAETAVIAHKLYERGNLAGDYFWGVSPATIEIKVGEQKEIKLLSQKELLAYTPVFGLDNPEIGTISQEGIFTAVKPGKGLITVNLGNKHHDVVVTVYQ
ncbi:S-layer homology domain-containing protein [Geosporobacter ferrireducens]|uniref:SLH domain-containing protein n=1 Tax=Geosporobacter ferrireducens TaxID=1424294 RepID=A0A1D8GMI5_9FIRM|nr:S-layer homology domain-containing protein [Geosporobacter ferrireducens]AOT72090.1 hypothetical protein Gferi_22645 [Geosporobacter ferrireducens]